MDPQYCCYELYTHMGPLAQVIIFVDVNKCMHLTSLNVSKVKVEYILCYLLLAEPYGIRSFLDPS